MVESKHFYLGEHEINEVLEVYYRIKTTIEEILDCNSELNSPHLYLKIVDSSVNQKELEFTGSICNIREGHISQLRFKKDYSGVNVNINNRWHYFSSTYHVDMFWKAVICALTDTRKEAVNNDISS